MSAHRTLLRILSSLVILSIMFSGFSMPSASAQGKDGLNRQVNPQTGKVSFIGPESGRALSARELGISPSVRAEDPGMALAKRFGPEFGLQNPARDLTELKTNRSEDGHLAVRYQQSYQGIPVMGGELIINTNENGDLYSMNGEVSPDLSLSTQPRIDPEEATQAALQGAAKWYEKAPEDFLASEPELWIYDEGLLRPSSRPAELVWRMEVTAVDNSLPVRELVLVHAERGHVSLHFNQVDTAWGIGDSSTALQDPDPTPTPLPTETPVPSETPLPSETSEPTLISTPTREEVTATEEVPARDASIDGAASLTDVTWYVATTGNDTNSCSVPEVPCATINGAIGKAASGETVKVVVGTYTVTDTGAVAFFNKNVILSGGWNAGFTAQNGYSTIDGQGTRLGVNVSNGVSAVVERMTVQNSGVIVQGSSSPGGILTLNNSTVSGNSGSGVYISDASATLTLNNSTISGNKGYGIFRLGGTVTLKNTIVAGNSTTSGGQDCYGTIGSAGYNLIGNTSGCTFTSTTGDLTNVDPQLGAFIGYYALAAGSPAIDAGNPATPGSGGNACLINDERGVIRPVGARCDIGAYEYTVPGSVASLYMISGNSQHIAPGLTLPNPLKVVALDGQNIPVPGVEITFTAPESGASGTFVGGNRTTTVTTNANGIATTPTFTANDVLGSYAIVASASGIESITFTLQNFAWYVATTGSDSNDCQTPSTPCATINGAIGKAADGDTVKVVVGTYTGTGTEVVLINKNVTLSTGWDVGFAAQSGQSIIDGQDTRRGVTVNTGVTAIVERVRVQNGKKSEGAGVYTRGNMLTLNNSTISSNDGVGIFNHGTVLMLNNSNINNNKGIGLYSNSGTSILNTSTVSGNTAENGGGIYRFGGTVTLKNTIVAGNSARISGTDCYGTIGSAGYNLIGNKNGCSFSATTGDLMGTNSNPIDPRLILLPTNSASTFTIALLAGSPAIDAGNPAAPGSGGNACLGTDQRGVTRPSGSRCDIGAFEYQGNGTISAYIVAYSGTPQHLALGDPSQSVLKAVILDEDGDTVSGKTVTFTAPNSGPSATFESTETNISTAITDANGIATSSAFSANSIPGSYVIQAAVSGLAGSANFQITNGTQVKTYTANHTTDLPGSFVCDHNTPVCTNGNDLHADKAQLYALDIYSFFVNKHGRNSFDNNGMPIISTVHYGLGYANAFWNGDQIVYGDAYGYPLADDVVAHELTHGMTQFESNLFYYYQSGAINESLSDLWGEYYDQTNGLGEDGAIVKWQIGEEVAGLGAQRSMSDPTFYGDPDSMSSPYYYEGTADSGGVHTNSGVNNKAVYLMVEGSTDYGILALGWDKTAAIYYEANTNLLTSGADYSDLYYALQQACLNLIGQTQGITNEDCAEVRDALDAVEMNAQPTPNFNTDAPFCDPGDPKIPVFADDLESGIGNWTFSNGAYPRWQLDSPYGPFAHSGDHFLYADDYPAVVTDTSARLVPITIPPRTYLHFAHAYDFETSNQYYDGGVLEYSPDGGVTWVDAGSLMDFNGYKGTIYNANGNPLGNPLSGRSAFVGTSHGYISTRVNLSSLAGQTVSFRWRMGLDQYGAAWGWWVDDVEIYQCQDLTPPLVSSILRASSSPTSASKVYFIVTFSELVNGVDSSDFSLNVGGGISGATIESITSLDNIYMVLVNTGTGGGTLRLDVRGTTGISDLAGNALANAPFTGEESYTLNSGQRFDLSVTRLGDFNGDRMDDVAVFRPSNGTWYISTLGNFVFGQSGDVPVPGDYNGDRRDDIAVYRPSNGTWYISTRGNFHFGEAGDIPVPADYDGNGTTDIAVYRPSNGTWYISTRGIFTFGQAGDIPIPGDYDGNGTADIAVYRPSNGTWYISSRGNFGFGQAGDVPIPGDYNRDGTTDIAVYRPSNGMWYISSRGNFGFGQAGDLPLPGDFNGDGMADVAVFRPSNGMWYISTRGNFLFGQAGDVPI